MKNTYLILFTLLCLACHAVAAPAYPGWITCIQPDSTAIELRQLGDEFYHYWINRDGQEMVQNEDGYWVVDSIQLTPEQRQSRRAASPMLQSAEERKASASRPSRVLVILMNFTDRTMQPKHTHDFFYNMLNQLDSVSVREYFKQSSDGNYIPQFDVFGPFTSDSAMAYYGANNEAGNDLRVGCLIHEACLKAHETGCNFANYDENKDGTVDNINVIFAGYSEASGGGANCIWPNQWNLKDCRNCGGKYYLDGKRLLTYSCSAELRGSSGANSAGIGTFCHEFSHIVGMPDYYDTKYGDNYKNDMTPGCWSIMDAGNYNNNGQSPPLYSVFDKCYMGWASTPALLAKNDSINVTMPYGTAYSRTITGTTTAKPYTSTDTIYYLENRPKTGFFDIGLPYGGMLIWRVIYKSSWGAVNTITGELHYTLLSARGTDTGFGTNKDCYPGPNNVTSKTVWPGCELSSITNTNNIISFKYNGGEQIKLHHTWMANAATFANTESYIQLSMPSSSPEACSADKTFLGWTMQTIMQQDGSDLVLSHQLDEVAQDTTFYAVYRSITAPYRYFYLCNAQVDTTHIHVNIPEGQTYTWKGRVLTPGDYYDTIKTIRGDSLEALHLRYIAPERLVKIYFYNTPDWKNVTYHVWGGTGTATSFPYPLACKEAFTHNGHTIWSFSFEEGQYNNILFLSRENHTLRTTSLNNLSANRGKCLNTNKDNLSSAAWWSEVPVQDYIVSFGYGKGGASVLANNGAITSGGYADQDSLVIFTQTPAKGYRFKEWNTKQDGTGTTLDTAAIYSSIISGPVTVYAIFSEQYYIETNLGGLGWTPDTNPFDLVDGIFFRTFTGQTSGTYSYRLTRGNGWEWDNFEKNLTIDNSQSNVTVSLNGQNKQFSIATQSTVTVSFNPTTLTTWVVAQSENKVTVYYYNRYDWEGVRYHAWGGNLPATTWPGLDATLESLTHEGHAIYSVTFFEGDYDRIKFNDKQDANNQTGNLYNVLTNNGKCAYYDSDHDPTTWWGDLPNPDTPTELINVNENVNENVSRKMIINNQLIIFRNGKTYNAQGTRL